MRHGPTKAEQWRSIDASCSVFMTYSPLLITFSHSFPFTYSSALSCHGYFLKTVSQFHLTGTSCVTMGGIVHNRPWSMHRISLYSPTCLMRCGVFRAMKREGWMQSCLIWGIKEKYSKSNESGHTQYMLKWEQQASLSSRKDNVLTLHEWALFSIIS